ncbi:MAG TPA: aldo/keto reductase [Steroidobacteraceae bacterium]|nr:aldo/keto reductase [Steroidobacteraceae bacterium]
MTNDYIETAAGVQMPRIIYGTAWKKEKTATCVTKALTTGFRGIDTACQPKHYFERGVGDGIVAFLNSSIARSVKREQLYIQTKFTPLSGQDAKQVPYDSKAPLNEQVAQSIQVSLRNLQTEYLDCLVLHSPLMGQSMEMVWRAMEAHVDSGVIRQLGLSNCYEPEYFEQLYRWARIKPAVLQNRFYDATGYDRELRAFCRKHRVVYQSFWTLTANPHLLTHNTIKGLASKYGRTPPQILFRFLSHDEIVPLTGTQSEIHMREDLDIFSFALTDTERLQVTALLDEK